jgi:hypothetical protein
MDCFVALLLAMTRGASGTNFPLTHFEPCACHSDFGDRQQGTIMADRRGLKFVGFIFATVTLAVMLTTVMVVKGNADGAYSPDHAPVASR